MVLDTITDLKVIGGWVILNVQNKKLIVFDFEAESGMQSSICKVKTRVDKIGEVDAKLTENDTLVIIAPTTNRKGVQKITCFKDGGHQVFDYEVEPKYSHCTLSDCGKFVAFADKDGIYLTVYTLDGIEKLH